MILDTFAAELTQPIRSRLRGVGPPPGWGGPPQADRMVDATGTTTYAYDNRDRLISKATPEGTLSYTYDGHSNVLTIASSNTNGASMTYTYDALNRLATVTDNRLAAQGVNPATSNGSLFRDDPVVRWLSDAR